MTKKAKKPAKPASSPTRASRDKKIWKLADQSRLLNDGELEMDLDAKVSESDDNGAYIQTWMWLSYEGTELDKGEPPGPKDWSPFKHQEPTREKIMALARKNQNKMLRDGELELDMDAVISEGDDNGAYVQVWMWVPFSGTPLDKE